MWRTRKGFPGIREIFHGRSKRTHISVCMCEIPVKVSRYQIMQIIEGIHCENVYLEEKVVGSSCLILHFMSFNAALFYEFWVFRDICFDVFFNGQNLGLCILSVICNCQRKGVGVSIYDLFQRLCTNILLA